jgi:hypothetical protein
VTDNANNGHAINKITIIGQFRIITMTITDHSVSCHLVHSVLCILGAILLSKQIQWAVTHYRTTRICIHTGTNCHLMPTEWSNLPHGEERYGSFIQNLSRVDYLPLWRHAMASLFPRFGCARLCLMGVPKKSCVLNLTLYHWWPEEILHIMTKLMWHRGMHWKWEVMHHIEVLSSGI